MPGTTVRLLLPLQNNLGHTFFLAGVHSQQIRGHSCKAPQRRNDCFTVIFHLTMLNVCQPALCTLTTNLIPFRLAVWGTQRQLWSSSLPANCVVVHSIGGREQGRLHSSCQIPCRCLLPSIKTGFVEQMSLVQPLAASDGQYTTMRNVQGHLCRVKAQPVGFGTPRQLSHTFRNKTKAD